MSATRYTLRTRSTHAGIAAQQGIVQTTKIGTNLLSSQECSNVMSAVALEPHASNACVIEGAACYYSDVAVRNCPKKEPLMHLKVWRRCGGGHGQR